MNDSKTSISTKLEKLEDWGSIELDDTLVFVNDHQLVVGTVVYRCWPCVRLSTGHVVLASDVQQGLVFVQPPPPEPWTLIPEGRENAAVLRVNGVVGTYWRAEAHDGSRIVLATITDAYGARSYAPEEVTSVEEVDIHDPAVQVPVGRELVERAARYVHWMSTSAGDIGDSSAAIIRDLAAYAETEADQ